MLGRAIVVAFCLLGGAAVLARSSKGEVVPIRESLVSFPMTLDGWQGQRLPDFEDRIEKVLGVDEYLNAAYVSRGRPSVGLYMGYYASQREGDTMHSPLNCLPGAGWLPVQQRRTTIDVEDSRGPRSIEVNNFIIEKGLERQVVIYWYQSHGRVVASEYYGKVYLVLDAVRLNRTDGAMIRVVVPILGSEAGAQQHAEQAGINFTRVLFRQLDRFLPA
jgi:EpsI family protein